MNGKLIITADDYGMCAAVNEAIEECLAAGTVRATCAMANMPAFASTANLRKRFPESSVGIHWTMTEGLPVLPPQQVASLVRTDGSFYPPLELRRRWLRRQTSAIELANELRAQYRRFREVAGEPDFWNTHQNFHVFPGLFEACVTLGQELKIPRMRCHRRFTVARERTVAAYNFGHPVSWVKGAVISWWSQRAAQRGMLMPAGIVHMPGYEADRSSIEEVVTRLPWAFVKGSLELIVHPATNNHDPLFHRNAERRLLEYRLLRDSRFGNRLRQLGIESVTFQALQNGS